MPVPAHVCHSKEVSGHLIHLNIIVDQYLMLELSLDRNQDANNTVVASDQLHFEYKLIVVYVINQIQTIKG